MRGSAHHLATSLAVLLVASSCTGGWSQGDDDDVVLPASLIGIGVTPGNPTVSLGESVQFAAVGYYSDQSTRDLTDVVSWESSDNSVIMVSSSLDQEGLGSPLAVGDARVRASFFELNSNEVAVTVTEAVVTDIQIQPRGCSLYLGESVQLVAEAEFSDGSRGNVSGTVRWITSNGAIVTVEGAGLVRATGLGTAEVRAVYEQGTFQFEGEPASVEVVGGEIVIDGADVRVLGMTAVSTGNGVDYTITVKNSGGTPASGFWVAVWLQLQEGPGLPPLSGDGEQFVELLDAGQSAEVFIRLENVSPGSYQSWAAVDALGSLYEGDLGENNNYWGPEPVTVSTSGGSSRAELSITYLQAYTQSAQGRVLYIVDVTNHGGEVAEDFTVGVFANPDFPPIAPAIPDEQVTIDSLGPGGTAFLNLAVRSLPSPWWHSFVLVDAFATVEEPNETNNLGSTQVLP
ncbi:MAG: hypothetical protein CMP23_03955 [Rickettsiales bacterium]|nr:hypothetical protein [Rickettsiales bacterium]|tara:strand:+ start:9235 stop:10608 length:1374 start_codon:yes stop_codon:yes gene_type:complete